MATAHVTAATVRSCIKICVAAQSEMEEAAKRISQSLRAAGEGWHDEKYSQLDEVVGECVGALRTPVKELEECRGDLERLLLVVEAYDASRVRG